MRKRKKKFTKIYNELCKIEFLYIAQNQALKYCYDNDLDYSHIEELNDIIREKLQRTRNQMDLCVLKL